MYIRRLFAKMANNQLLTTPKPFTVIVEGNIGSGKTTFVNHLKKLNNIEFVEEPVRLWQNVHGYNLLGMMYEDPKKWSFTFQTYVQLTMLQNHTFQTTQPIKVMERSLYSARYVFVEKMSRDNILPKPSVAVINEWFEWLCRNQDIGVDMIIYLRTTPEVVYERMLLRNREEEKNVPLDYLKSLHDIHEDWLYHKTLHKIPAPVVVLDGNKDLDVIQEEYGKCEDRILKRNVVSF